MLVSGTCFLIRAALEGCLCVQVGTDPPGHKAGQGGFLESWKLGYSQFIYI